MLDDGQVTDSLYKKRHSLAHIMAQAVLELQPEAELGFGPPVENGFYYDFRLTEALTPEDLPKIEKKMKRIIKKSQKFELRTMPVKEAIDHLKNTSQQLKSEYAEELGQRVDDLSFYKNGPFEDMCEGPHVEKTSQIHPGSFKLDSLAGSYWRGDSDRPMLTRIYGLAFETPEELTNFLKLRKLAMERDHRKLGRELELFNISEEVGQGLPLWLPNGTVLRDELEKFAKELEFKRNYVRVATPHITRGKLYEATGHLPYFKESMYSPFEIDGEDYYLKPMNCPHHHLIFNSRRRSYRELPLRLAEYGTCYRFEPSGTLSGLLRVRCLAMNDAHIYCSQQHVKAEFKDVLEMHKEVYEKFRITKFWVRLSLATEAGTDTTENKFIDNPQQWDFSEKIVRECLDETGIDYKAVFGEAAFYGPKVDFQIRNVIGREETASTNQLDVGVAPRLGLEFVGEDGERHTPYIIHRAPFGTHERFIAFLIEHFGGAFPTWMAPIQARFVPIAGPFVAYANRLATELNELGMRVEVDDSHETFNKKIRLAVTRKIPNILIIGEKEQNQGSITWRRYCEREQRTMPFEQWKVLIQKMLHLRTMDNFADEELPVV
ncbi:threonine--tRNA ligase [Candidatus Riflebacteria bacterium]